MLMRILILRNIRHIILMILLASNYGSHKVIFLMNQSPQA